MEIFGGDDSIKKDGSFLYDGEFGLSCGWVDDEIGLRSVSETLEYVRIIFHSLFQVLL